MSIQWDIKTAEDVILLFNQIGRYGGISTHGNLEVHEDGVRLSIFTDTNNYSIVARLPCEDMGNGYLGCIASCRKPRAGEDWTRGNDLPDGPLTVETWYAILASIVSYEMVKVHRQPMYPRTVPDESSGQPESEAA